MTDPIRQVIAQKIVEWRETARKMETIADGEPENSAKATAGYLVASAKDMCADDLESALAAGPRPQVADLIERLERGAESGMRQDENGNTVIEPRPKRTRCGDPHPTKGYASCGRYKGHEGPHREMCSADYWSDPPATPPAPPAVIPPQEEVSVGCCHFNHGGWCLDCVDAKGQHSGRRSNLCTLAHGRQAR